MRAKAVGAGATVLLYGSKRLSKVMRIDVQVVWRFFFSILLCRRVLPNGCCRGTETRGSGDLVEDSRKPISGAGVLRPFESIPRVVERASKYLLLNMLLY